MDKSAFYKSRPKEESNQGIAYPFGIFQNKKMSKMINKHPEYTDEFFNRA